MNKKMNFSLTQIEYVLAVYKLGHFAKAAEQCGVTQPTLSMQIQKLEEDLESTIFDRSKKPIRLTASGKELIEQFKQIILEAKKIESIVQKKDGSLFKGELRLGVIPTLSPSVLPRLLPVLEKKYPDIKLTIYELQTKKIVEALEVDEIDVGLLATPLKIPSIFEIPIFYEPFHLLCRKQHKYAVLKKMKYSALDYDDIWLLEEGHCLRNQVLDICAVKGGKSRGRKYQFESGSLETLKNLVLRYGGYTLIPELSLDKNTEEMTIVPFERPIPAREVGLVYTRKHYKIELIEAIADAITNSLPEHIRKLRQKDLDVLPV